MNGERNSILTTIVTHNLMWENHIAKAGIYNIKKEGHSFEYDGKLWTYWNSGLAREVYMSDCGKWVIKVPISNYFQEKEIGEYLDELYSCAPPSIQHNIGEAEAYAACPAEFKGCLAKTELLPNCWVRQEFVKVHEIFTGDHRFREIGQREDGSWCIFDYDPLLDDFKFEGCRWERLPDLVIEGISSIKK